VDTCARAASGDRQASWWGGGMGEGQLHFPDGGKERGPLIGGLAGKKCKLGLGKKRLPKGVKRV